MTQIKLFDITIGLIIFDYQFIYWAFKKHTELTDRYGKVQGDLAVNEDKLHYLFVTFGSENRWRFYGCIVYWKIVGDQIWIHADGWEYGIADNLVNVGIPKSQFFLGFYLQEVAMHTEFAV